MAHNSKPRLPRWDELSPQQQRGVGRLQTVDRDGFDRMRSPVERTRSPYEAERYRDEDYGRRRYDDDRSRYPTPPGRDYDPRGRSSPYQADYGRPPPAHSSYASGPPSSSPYLLPSYASQPSSRSAGGPPTSSVPLVPPYPVPPPLPKSAGGPTTSSVQLVPPWQVPPPLPKSAGGPTTSSVTLVPPYAAPPMGRQYSGGLSASKNQQKPLSAISQGAILLNLPASADDEMLRQFLESMGCAIESCTVVYDRETRASRRFGFARFVSVEHARAFVEPNWPTVIWHDKSGRGLPEEEGMKIKIDFSQTEKQSQLRPPPVSSNGYSAAPPAEVKSKPANLPPNDGVRDIGPVPSNMLLLRGLDPLSRESEIAAAVDKLPGLVPENNVRQVLHIKDRTNKSSIGFAFVVFKDAKAAADVLSKIWNPEANPQGWRVRGHAVTATFAHTESFRPAYASSSWSFKNEGGKELLYWDERAFVSSWRPDHFRTEGNMSKSSGNGSAGDDADAFLASFGQPDTATSASSFSLPEKGVAASTPVHNGTNMSEEAALRARLMANGASENAAAKSTLLTPRSSGTMVGNGPAAASHQSSPASPQFSAAPVSKDKKAPTLIASKKAAPNIAKWNDKQSELHGGGDAGAATQNKRKAEDEAADDGFPLGDPQRMICLLCARQFQKVEDLTRHNDLSNLHKTNLENADLVKAAQEKKAATPQYRDRAAERRQAFNQPDKPGPGSDGRSGKKARKEPAPQPATPAADATQGISGSNVGHKMLAAAGWKQGEGLGVANGRIDPVQAQVYASGAGLGAGSGVDAAQAGGSVWNAPSTGREKARQRFNEHS